MHVNFMYMRRAKIASTIATQKLGTVSARSAAAVAQRSGSNDDYINGREKKINKYYNITTTTTTTTGVLCVVFVYVFVCTYICYTFVLVY